MKNKPRSGQWILYIVSSGFKSPSMGYVFDDPQEAKRMYKDAMIDYENNGWSHSKEPTLYKRIELQDIVEDVPNG